MKGLVFAGLSLASVVLGAPSLNRRDVVTPQEFDALKLFAQWSSAASCNGKRAAGQPVTCVEGQCTLFESHGATVVASFGGSLLDMEGFVGIDPASKQIVVSFRGTTTTANTIADLLAVQVPCDFTSGCLVHTGFYASWLEVADRAHAAVTAALTANPSFSVISTGHSLGGAVATLAAASLRDAGVPVDLYTYGSPRVGNLAFAEYVTAQPGREYRVTHSDDPVPRLPPLLLNYRHTSPEYWIDAGSDGVLTTDEVKYCEGYASTGCNAGTTALDFDAHSWYFQQLKGCADSDPQTGAVSEDTKKQLTAYVEADLKIAVSLKARGDF
ncbi:Alpha/Beta hydrolase protein [Dichotomopilus funicola]|uniref:Alpha/Beta hydrolase protein n=1 Tax=Dichotomopilus funicola TaxID=1934379 RepID=A0AAN6VAX1_9PEZI|nr:Alpha/Beta hydrolase protein [Dichotomopilus funicola]